MNQVEMSNLLLRIAVMINQETGANLYEGTFNPDRLGMAFGKNDFFYDVSSVRTVELWRPHQKFEERISIDVYDKLIEPSLGQFILDAVRKQIGIWLEENNSK